MTAVTIMGCIDGITRLRTVDLGDHAADVLTFTLAYGTGVKKDGTKFTSSVPVHLWKNAKHYATGLRDGDIVVVTGSPANEKKTGREKLGWCPIIRAISIHPLGPVNQFPADTTIFSTQFTIMGKVQRNPVMAETAAFLTVQGAVKPGTKFAEWHKVNFYDDVYKMPEGIVEGDLISVTGQYRINAYEYNGEKRVEAYCLAEFCEVLGKTKPAEAAQSGGQEAEDVEVEDDDIPF